MTPTGDQYKNGFSWNLHFSPAIVLFWADMSTVTMLNDFFNIVMAIQLPFAIIPALCFSSSSFIMGQFANSTVSKICVFILSATCLVLNWQGIYTYVTDIVPNR